jgi:hypothetical protein
VLAHAIAAVDEGRREANGAGGGSSPLAAEGAVGAVLSVIHARLLDCSPALVDGPSTGEDVPGNLVDLANPLMSMIVLPYLGSAAARRELQQPVPEHKPRPAPNGASTCA